MSTIEALLSELAFLWLVGKWPNAVLLVVESRLAFHMTLVIRSCRVASPCRRNLTLRMVREARWVGSRSSGVYARQYLILGCSEAANSCIRSPNSDSSHPHDLLTRFEVLVA